MASSSDVLKLFLQAIFSRRVVSQALAMKLWEKCVYAVRGKPVDDSLEIPFVNTRDAWDAWVTRVNSALNPLDLEFAHMHDQTTGKEVYALVNRKGDEVAQLASDYSPNEITYFKAVVEQIMLAPNESYCISSFSALREVSSLKQSMTKTQGEVVLTSFVAKGWLHRSQKGRYTLSQRSLLELQSYLRSTYPEEILECTICFEMVTQGMACRTRNCKARLHQHCYHTYLRRSDSCPSCAVNWGNDASKVVPIGEDAFKEGQDKGKRRIKQREEGSDEDEEGEDVPSQQTQSEPRQIRKGRGKRGTQSNTHGDADEEEGEEAPPPTSRKRSGRR